VKKKIIKWIVWRLPPRILYWAVIRGFGDASTGKWENRLVADLDYPKVMDAISEKYNL